MFDKLVVLNFSANWTRFIRRTTSISFIMSMKAATRTSSVEESYTNTNFWGIDGYKNTVKRLDDGATLCDEFMKMVHERADIEMKYTLKLRDWSKRWSERINGRISEYGGMLEVFKATLREAEEVAELHVERHHGLKADLCESIKQWKNQHYHKSVLKWKEVKECETGFTKIYEPWARRYNKMDKSKKNFHRAAKASEHASLIASNAEKDGSMPEKIKKLQDQDTKLKAELEEARKKYERRLSEMNASNQTYADELEAEFIKWERFEKVRLTFFKDALQRYHNVLDISENERYVMNVRLLLAQFPLLLSLLFHSVFNLPESKVVSCLKSDFVCKLFPVFNFM